MEILGRELVKIAIGSVGAKTSNKVMPKIESDTSMYALHGLKNSFKQSNLCSLLSSKRIGLNWLIWLALQELGKEYLVHFHIQEKFKNQIIHLLRQAEKKEEYIWKFFRYYNDSLMMGEWNIV